jgi:hypothetical protein
MECEPAQSHCTQPAGSVSRVRSAGGEIQTVGCEARYALYLLFLQEQIKDIRTTSSSRTSRARAAE